ncbi:MAG: pitrilysin family protein [Bacteroidota bacterium]
MKNNTFFLCLLVAMVLANCSPKVGDQVQKKAEEKAATVMVGKEDFRKQVPSAGPPPKIQIGSSEQFELDNGLKVILVENHKLPRVSYRLFVNTPDIMQNEKAGYIDMAGELLNKGTANRKKAEIDEAIDFMGASLNTTASGIFASSLTKHTENLLEIMSDVLLNPSFPESEFAKAKKQTLSNLAQSKEDPSEVSRSVSNVLRYGKNHPYGEIMTEATIENITREDCKDYYETFFKPNISYLVVVGDVDMAKAKPMIEKYFSSWKSSNNIPKVDFPTPQAPENTTVDFINKTGAVQSVISVTYPVELKPGHPDVIKSRVMNTMLGGFFQSRLNQNLRETNAYTYGAGSRLSSDEKVGSFRAGASVRNEVTDSSIMELVNELNRIRDEQIDQADLDMVKNVIAGSFARSLEQPETVANFALNTARYGLPADYYTTYLQKLDQVSLNDVQMMAQKYIRPANAHIVVVGNKDEVAEKLGKFTASGKVDFYDPYGNEITSEIPIPDGVTAKY